MPSLLAERVKTAAAIVAVALGSVRVWYLSNLVLIVMGAILVAIGPQLGAEPFQRWLRFPAGISLAVSGLLIAANKTEIEKRR